MGNYFKDPLNFIDPLQTRKLIGMGKKDDKKEEQKVAGERMIEETRDVMENGMDKEKFQRIGRAAMTDFTNPRRGVFEGYSATRRSLMGGVANV